MTEKVERVFATIAALLVFTLHEMQLFNSRPREMADAYVHAVWVRTFGAPEQVFLSFTDIAARWGLVALTLGLATWALFETFERKPAPQRAK